METILVDLHTFRLFSDGNRYYVDCNYWEQGYVNPDRECIEIDAAASFALTTLDPRLVTTLRIDAQSFTLVTYDCNINERTVIQITSQIHKNLNRLPFRIIDVTPVDVYAFVAVTNDPKINLILRPDKAEATLTALTAGVNEIISIDSATFNLSTNDPNINERLIPDPASFTLTTQDIAIDESIIPDTHVFVLSPQPVEINAEEVIAVDVASFILTANVVTPIDTIRLPRVVFDINKLPPSVYESTIINIEGISDTAPPELPTIAARATQTDAAANTVPITLPTHAAGQLIVSFISTADNTSIGYDIITEGTRDGWFVNNVTSLSSTDTSLAIAWKVAESASESLTFDLFNARASKTITYVIDNANDLYLNSDNNFFGTDPAALFNPISLEQEHACLMLAAVGTVNDGIVTVAPTGYTIEDTIQGGVSFDSSVSVCSKGAYLNTSEQPDSATLSTTTGWVSWTVAAINRDPNETVFRKRFNFNDRSEFFDGNGNLDNEWTEGNVGVFSHSITQTSGATSGLDEGFFLIRHTGVDESAGYIEWTGTFEQLGVTAGSQISGYGVPSIWYRAYNQNGGTARLGAPTYGYDAIEVTDANGTYTVLPAQAAQAADTGFIEVTGTQVGTATPLASNSTVTIRIYAEMQGNLSNANIDYDDLFFFVDVIPAEVIKSGFTLNLQDNNVVIEEEQYVVLDLLEFNINPLAAQALGFLDIRDEVAGFSSSPVPLPVHQEGDLLVAIYTKIKDNSGLATEPPTVTAGWAVSEDTSGNYIEDIPWGDAGSIQNDDLAVVVVTKRATSSSETLDITIPNTTGTARSYAASIIGGTSLLGQASWGAYHTGSPSTFQPERDDALAARMDWGATYTGVGLEDDYRKFQVLITKPLHNLATPPTAVVGPQLLPDVENFTFTASPTESPDIFVQSFKQPSVDASEYIFGLWDFNQDVKDGSGYIQGTDSVAGDVTQGYVSIGFSVFVNIIEPDVKTFSLSTGDVTVSPDEQIIPDTKTFSLTPQDATPFIDFSIITVRDVAVDEDVSGSFITMPEHAVGDLLFAMVFLDDHGGTYNLLSSGWKLLRQLNTPVGTYLFFKNAQSTSETLQVTFDTSDLKSYAMSITNTDDIAVAGFNGRFYVSGGTDPAQDTPLRYDRPRIGELDPYRPQDIFRRNFDDLGELNIQTLVTQANQTRDFLEGPVLTEDVFFESTSASGTAPYIGIEYKVNEPDIEQDQWTYGGNATVNERYVSFAIVVGNSTKIFVNDPRYLPAESSTEFVLNTNAVTVNAEEIINIDTKVFTLIELKGGINEIVPIDAATITLTPNGVQTNITIAPLSFSLNALQTAVTQDEITEFTLVVNDLVVNAREVIEIDTASFTFTPLIAGVGDVVAGNLVTFTLTPNTYLVNDVVGFPTIVFDLVQQELQANAKDIVTIDAVVSFALVVQEPTVKANDFVEIVPAPSIVLTPNTFLVNDIIAIDVVNFNLTTQIPGIDQEIAPAAETFTLVTSIVNVKLPINIDATVDLNLSTLTAGVNEVVPVESASIVLSANDVVINAREVTAIDTAALSLVTQQPNINESLTPAAESYTLVTTETRVNNSELIFIDLATITLSTQDGGVNEIVVIDTASLNLLTNDARINQQFRVLMDAAAFATTTQSVILNAEFIVFVDTALLTLTTNDSVTNEQFIVFVDTDSFTVTTLLSNVREVQLIPLTEFNVTTNDVVVNEEYQVMVDTYSYSLSTLVAGINEIVPVDAAALNITALDVIVNEQFIAFIDPFSFALVEQVAGINDIIAIDLVTQTLVLYQTDFDSTIEGFVGTVTEGGWELESATIGTTTAVLVAVMTSTTSAPVAIDTRAEGTWTVPVVEFT